MDYLAPWHASRVPRANHFPRNGSPEFASLGINPYKNRLHIETFGNYQSLKKVLPSGLVLIASFDGILVAGPLALTDKARSRAASNALCIVEDHLIRQGLVYSHRSTCLPAIPLAVSVLEFTHEFPDLYVPLLRF